jgi:hypothetical protein
VNQVVKLTEDAHIEIEGQPGKHILITGSVMSLQESSHLGLNPDCRDRALQRLKGPDSIMRKIKDLFVNICASCVYSQKSTTNSKAIPRIGLDGFYPWDGLAIRGNNSSVAAKGCRRMNTDKLETISNELETLSVNQKLQLIERLARSVRNGKEHSSQEQREALEALRKELASLPVNNPDDGFSNRDHDSLLYGESA